MFDGHETPEPGAHNQDPQDELLHELLILSALQHRFLAHELLMRLQVIRSELFVISTGTALDMLTVDAKWLVFTRSKRQWTSSTSWSA